MSNLISYTFHNTKIHAVIIESELFFRATELAIALGYKNPRQALASHVDKEDVQKLDTPTKGGNQKVSYVNESGMYALILGSEKTEAKQFKKWVTSEVLPSIRKTGGYMTDVTLTRHQRTQIKRAVVLFIGQTGRTAQEVYKLLYARFGVQSYQDIPARHFDEAMSIIEKETQKGRPCILLDKTCNNNFLLHVKNGGVTVFVPSLNSYVVTKI